MTACGGLFGDVVDAEVVLYLKLVDENDVSSSTAMSIRKTTSAAHMLAVCRYINVIIQRWKIKK